MPDEFSGAIEALKIKAQNQAEIVNGLPEMAEFVKVLAALNVLEDLCGIEKTTFGVLFGAADSPAPKRAQSYVKVGDFFGKKPLEAAKLFLKAKNGPATLDEIIENLTIASCPVPNKEDLRTSLGRSTFEIARLNENTFDLLERYPDEQKKRLNSGKKRGSSSSSDEASQGTSVESNETDLAKEDSSQ